MLVFNSKFFFRIVQVQVQVHKIIYQQRTHNLQLQPIGNVAVGVHKEWRVQLRTTLQKKARYIEGRCLHFIWLVHGTAKSRI